MGSRVRTMSSVSSRNPEAAVIHHGEGLEALRVDLAIRSGERRAGGAVATAFTTVKIAEFAPTPSAGASIAMAVKPGVFHRLRSAYRIP